MKGKKGPNRRVQMYNPVFQRTGKTKMEIQDMVVTVSKQFPSTSRHSHDRALLGVLISAFTVGLVFSLTSCNGCPPANTLQPWPGYKHLVSPSIFRWIVLKCTLSDNRTVPSGVDDLINHFLTVAGVGTGNLFDYYGDVSYGAIEIQSRVYGWYPASFDATEKDLTGAQNRYKRVQLCADAISQSDFGDIDLNSYWGIIMVTNHKQDGGACYDGQSSLTIKGKSYNLACVVFDKDSLFTAFASHEVGHGLGMPHSYDNTQNTTCGALKALPYQASTVINGTL
jgi:hypothetical protein